MDVIFLHRDNGISDQAGNCRFESSLHARSTTTRVCFEKYEVCSETIETHGF